MSEEELFKGDLIRLGLHVDLVSPGRSPTDLLHDWQVATCVANALRTAHSRGNGCSQTILLTQFETDFVPVEQFGFPLAHPFRPQTTPPPPPES